MPTDQGRRWYRWRCARCPLPVRATALQPAMDSPPSLEKSTLPVGATPVVVAVEGHAGSGGRRIERAVSVVVVAVGALELTTCDSVLLVGRVVAESPA